MVAITFQLIATNRQSVRQCATKYRGHLGADHPACVAVLLAHHSAHPNHDVHNSTAWGVIPRKHTVPLDDARAHSPVSLHHPDRTLIAGCTMIGSLRTGRLAARNAPSLRRVLAGRQTETARVAATVPAVRTYAGVQLFPYFSHGHCCCHSAIPKMTKTCTIHTFAFECFFSLC